mmetsp:Transcript_22516/g.51705  ORF Transcript_22516/g.51705 Transcript_22516/m.51705 type:complete len:94 (-) Transcript_22516:2062-2343(-)
MASRQDKSKIDSRSVKLNVAENFLSNAEGERLGCRRALELEPRGLLELECEANLVGGVVLGACTLVSFALMLCRNLEAVPSLRSPGAPVLTLA